MYNPTMVRENMEMKSTLTANIDKALVNYLKKSPLDSSSKNFVGILTNECLLVFVDLYWVKI